MAANAASVPSAVMISARASTIAPAMAVAPVTGALSTADAINRGCCMGRRSMRGGWTCRSWATTG